MVKRLLLSSMLLAAGARADTQAVMLFLSARDQSDTLGYNIVDELPALFYEQIASGSLPLWDSPEKQVRIQPASLKRIEQNNGVSFLTSHQLFILETWTTDRTTVSTNLSGFYFTDRTASGKEISYGFVDYNDAELLLTSESIQANANGSCFSTFKYILLNHLYYYSIVQFGKKKISSLAESQEIKSRFSETLLRQVEPIALSKKITYRVDKEGAATSGQIFGEMILKLVEEYLERNREVYMNMGGDRYTNFAGLDSLHVTALEVEEIWTRNDSGFETQLLSVVILMESGPLHSLSQEALWKLDLRWGEYTLNALLKEKEFYFRILAINADRISPEESPKYRNALEKYPWNRIREYARYE